MPGQSDSVAHPSSERTKSSTSKEMYRERIRAKDPRLLQFFDASSKHPAIEWVHERVMHFSRCPVGLSMLLIVGPTGVGKTLLMERIRRDILETATEEMRRDPGHIPVLCASADATETGNFRMRYLYWDLLEDADEPDLAHKQNPDTRRPRVDQLGRSYPKVDRGTEALRKVLENCIRERRVLVLLIDEAQGLTKVASARMLKAHMEVLKMLAKDTRVLIVLAGHYDLLDLFDLSSQNVRLSNDLHFSRYRAEIPLHAKLFRDVIYKFQTKVPLTKVPDLRRLHWQYLYEQTLGCIGMLKDLFLLALGEAIDAGRDELMMEDFYKHERSLTELERMRLDIQQGEERMAMRNVGKLSWEAAIAKKYEKEFPVQQESSKEQDLRATDRESRRRDFRRWLGLDLTQKEDKARGHLSETPQAPPEPPPSSKRRGVGKRKAVRDQVGEPMKKAKPAGAG